MKNTILSLLAVGFCALAVCASAAQAEAQQTTGGIQHVTNTHGPIRLATPHVDTSASERPKACQLVTAAEMSAILGEEVIGRPDNRFYGKTTCRYSGTDGDGPHLEFSVDWGEAAAMAAGLGMMSNMEPGMTSLVSDLGDGAKRIGPMLMITRGEDLITLVSWLVANQHDIAKRILQTAKPRMPAPSGGDVTQSGAGRQTGQPGMQALSGTMQMIADVGAARLLSSPKPGADSPSSARKTIEGSTASSDQTRPAAGQGNGATQLELDATGLPAAPHIPFMVGLTTVSAISEANGDYEAIGTIETIGDEGYRLRTSTERPAADGSVERLAVTRFVLAEDQAHSHRMRGYFVSGDPERFPGTVPGVSAAMLRELADAGATEMTILEIGTVFGVSFVKRELTGTLHRVGDGPVRIPMLVNGRKVAVSVIHARGDLTAGGNTVLHELYILDDPGNPRILRFTGSSFGNTLRIEFPVAENAPNSIEQRLRKRETVDVHSIYFAFNRADIRPESERVLKEIARILHEHPDWKLQIDGHTDAIGSDADNLALSRRRAAAVKAALVDGYHIDAARLATGGHGESQPKDTNDTPEGRAHNRRVELSRLQ